MLFCIPRFATAQLPQSVPVDTAGYLEGLIVFPDSSFWKIDELATTYFGTTNDSVSPQFLKRYARWDYFWRSRVDATGDRNTINEIVLDLAINGPICSDNAQWVQKGPAIPGIQRSGIVTAVYSPPGQTNNPPDLIYVGSNTGGMWRTDNGGNLWENITDELRVPGLGIQDIVGDPSVGNNPQDPDLIYVATGKTGAFQNNSYGIGVLKYHRTVNSSGSLEWNWEETALAWSSAFGKVVSKIILHPDPDPNIFSATPVFCITGKTFERSLDQLISIDGSATLIPTSSDGRFLLDLDILPAAGTNGEDILFIAEGISTDDPGTDPRIWMSDDLGDSWVDISPNILPGQFATKGFILSTTQSTPTSFYAVAQDIGQQGPGFYTLRYDLSGSSPNTWSIVSHDPSLNPGRNTSVMSGPLRPDYVINDLNEDVMYYAANTLQKTTDGGNTRTTSTVYDPGTTHADIRDILLYESGNHPNGDTDRLFVGNDGGVAFKNGTAPWINLNGNSLILTQFFDIANTTQRSDFYCGGAQDNGTYYYDGLNWSGAEGGDGGQTIVDWSNPQIVYGRNNESITRSTDGGIGFSSLRMVYPQNNVTPYPYVQDQYKPNIIYGVSQRVVNNEERPRFYELDVTTKSFLQDILIQTDPTFDQGSKFNAINTIEVGHKINPNGTITDVIFIANNKAKRSFSNSLPNHGIIWRGERTGAGPFTWEALPCRSAWDKLINAIEVDPSDPDRIWLGFSGFSHRIEFSSDGGQTFSNMIDNFPVDLPVNDLVYVEGSDNTLYAATDVGVYKFVYDPGNNPASPNPPTYGSWECFNSGLPVCVVTDLEIDYCRNMLVIGTYGRGIWETPIDPVSPCNQITISQNTTWGPGLKNVCEDIIIEPGALLVIQGFVNFCGAHKIIVKPGAKLVVDGGTISSRDTWAGIEVWGDKTQPQTPTVFPYYQGSVDLVNGATIEHARNAISMGEHQPYKTIPSGGVVTANNAIFRNNRRSVEFLKYGFQNASAFNNVTFTVDAGFRFTDDFPAHVTLWDVKGVKFENCTFENNLNGKAWDEDYSNGIFSIDAGYEVVGGCIFEGFNRGVRASGAATMNNIVIKHSDFSNNAWGSLITEFDNPVISDNDFHVGTDYLLSANNNYEGLILSGSDGFLIEDNFFTKTANITLVEETRGIRVFNSLGSENEIYKNSFYDLILGVMSEGINREINVTNDSGLQFLCNSFLEISKHDIEAESEGNPNTTPFTGMRDIQGSLSPVSFPRNDFYYGTSFAENDVRNVAGNIVTYVHDGSGVTEPLSYTAGKVNLSTQLTVVSLVTCGDYVIGTDIVPLGTSLKSQIMADFESADSAHANILYNLNQLIDGGNTTQMLNQIQQGWTQGAWDLRNDLMSQSPYVSSEVLMEVAEGDQLPHAMLLEVCLANPDATREGEFIDFIETGISNPMPSYMIDMIVASWGEITARTLLQSGLGYYGRERSVAANILLADLKSDSLDHTADIRYWLNRRGEMSDHYALVESYISTNQFDSALIVLNAVPDSFDIADIPFLSQTQADFQTYLKFREDLNDDNRSIMELDSLEIMDLQNLAYGSNNRVAGLADNILCFGYGICKDRTASDSTGSTSRRANPFMDPQEFIKTQYYQLKVYPNPASEYATFEWDLVDLESQTSLIILDASGRIVRQIPIDAMKGQWIWDTRTIPTGLYLYELRNQDELLSQGKLAVE